MHKYIGLRHAASEPKEKMRICWISEPPTKINKINKSLRQRWNRVFIYDLIGGLAVTTLYLCIFREGVEASSEPKEKMRIC